MSASQRLAVLTRLTVVLLIQQVFCGREEHFHEFRNLPDDVDRTQRRLWTQRPDIENVSLLNEETLRRFRNIEKHD